MLRNGPSRRDTRGKRESNRLFEIGGQWLQEEGTGYCARCWYCPAARKVRRRSLRTKDFEAAKIELVSIVLGEPSVTPLSADAVPMISVTAAYLECRGEQIRSKNAAKRACKLVNDYLKMVVPDRAPLINDFGLARQHAFMRWCRDEHGLSAKSITTYLSTIKAAISLASTPRIICDSKGVEREAKLLDVPFFIQASEQEVANVTGLPPSQPRDFIPSDAQLAAFIDAIYDENDESEE